MNFRPQYYESASETGGDHRCTVTAQNLWQLECNLGDSLSQSPFLLESAFVFEALPQNCILGDADLSALCSHDLKQ